MTRVLMKCSNPKLYPARAHPTDAGADLRSTEYHEIYPGEMCLVDTGVALQIPVGYAGLVVPRSSMGKIQVSIANTIGVIDSDYRGNILVRFKNNGEDPFIIEKEDTRIAQLLIVPIVYAWFEPVEWDHEIWNNTNRGTGGFGSTGE